MKRMDGGSRKSWRIRRGLWLGLLGMSCCLQPVSAQLSFAKIDGLPDQFLGEYILREVYKALQISVHFQTLPAKRALSMSNDGRVDGETRRLVFIEDAAPNLVRIPTPMDKVEAMMFSRSQAPFINLESLGEKSLAYVDGVAGFKPLLPFFKTRYPLATEKQVWRMLAKGHADITSAGRVHGLFRLRTLGIANIHPMEPPRKVYQTYHYLHEKHRSLVPKVDRLFRAWRASGKLQRLRREAVALLMEKAQQP